MRRQAMHAGMLTAGERVELACAISWISGVLEEGAGGTGGQAGTGGDPPGVRVTVERESAPFDVTGWRLLTRGAWCRQGQVVMRNACSSGLDLLIRSADPTLDIVARWRPAATERAAKIVLRARSRLLLRAVLMQYPALWRAQQRGRAPLHASVCDTGPGGWTVLLAGPGGIGKSTLVHGEMNRGSAATCDNLCVSDGIFTWGVAEPLRLPAGTGGVAVRGRRMPHGRRETPWPARLECMLPDHLIVLVRNRSAALDVAPCDPAEAARYLAAGTYMAGELRRYWGFAATLALGTGVGSCHPPVAEVAAALSGELPCLKVALGEGPGALLRDLTRSFGPKALEGLS